MSGLYSRFQHFQPLLQTSRVTADCCEYHSREACATPRSDAVARAASSLSLHALTWAGAVQGVQGISDIITIPGLVNVDFADVKAVMCNSGTAMLGVGVATGKNRAEEAALVRMHPSALPQSVLRCLLCCNKAGGVLPVVC